MSETDYRDLLRRYVNLVFDREGYDFLDDAGFCGAANLSEEEKKEIRGLLQ